MRHNYVIEGPCHRLRPVELSDADLIDELRQDPNSSRFLHSSSREKSAQIEWISRYFETPGDFYFVVEGKTSREACGLISLYEVSAKNMSAEWGRWIIRPGSLAGIESVLLILQFGFEVIRVDRTYCRTITANEQVVSFHDSLGLKRVAVMPRYLEKDGEVFDAIEHELSVDNWPVTKDKLVGFVSRLCARKAG